MLLLDDQDQVLLLWRHRFIPDRWGTFTEPSSGLAHLRGGPGRWSRMRLSVAASLSGCLSGVQYPVYSCEQ
jgi:hypothetical protein